MPDNQTAVSAKPSGALVSKRFMTVGCITIVAVCYLVARHYALASSGETRNNVPATAPALLETSQVPKKIPHILDIAVGTNWFNPYPESIIDISAFPTVGKIRWDVQIWFKNGVVTNVPMLAIDDPDYHNLTLNKPFDHVYVRTHPGQGVDSCPFRFVMGLPTRN